MNIEAFSFARKFKLISLTEIFPIFDEIAKVTQPLCNFLG